jgi:hypothetical protein
MEQHATPVIPPAHEVESVEPEHLILWLDQHIGLPDECILLKTSFFLAINPTSGLYERSLNIDDIDRSIRLRVPVLVKLDQVVFMFQAFDNVEECFKVIEKRHKKQRIFFITSGSKGRIIIPSLVINFPEMFVEQYWIYVFCANMNMTPVEGVEPPTNSWALHFQEQVWMFDHQDPLLASMVLDIANHFFTKARGLDNDPGLLSAKQHYKWSRIMYERYETMIGRNSNTKLSEIDQFISVVDQRLAQRRDSDDDGYGETCD